MYGSNGIFAISLILSCSCVLKQDTAVVKDMQIVKACRFGVEGEEEWMDSN